ncbi:MAG: hypothetical protein RQ743_00205 [Bacteroidales bacterium]|nr:hypothetical protein [Bacteroidales bacterium]
MKKQAPLVFMLSMLIGLMVLHPLDAQDAGEDEIQSPYIEFNYLKNTEGHRILDAKIFLAGELGLIPLEGLPVKFYTNYEIPELLGEAITDKKGVAHYSIPENVVLPVDEDNNWWFYAEFEGNDRYEITMEELTVMDVNLRMSLEESEGKRKIFLEAFTVVDAEKIPVSNEDIFIFVPRMFSLLPVAEGYFIDGEAEVEFPDDIPGDENGNLTVIGRFNDHWQFGNVEQRAETNWGVPSSYEVAESHRALWTQIAPRWMIVTLTILLAGVWGHYLFAIVSMIRINRNGKKAE